MRPYLSRVAVEVRVHFLGFFSIDHLPDVDNDFTRVVVLDCGGPSGSDTVASIHKHHWNHGHVIFRLDEKSVVVEIG